MLAGELGADIEVHPVIQPQLLDCAAAKQQALHTLYVYTLWLVQQPAQRERSASVKHVTPTAHIACTEALMHIRPT
jgi:hypothetical protein